MVNGWLMMASRRLKSYEVEVDMQETVARCSNSLNRRPLNFVPANARICRGFIHSAIDCQFVSLSGTSGPMGFNIN